MRDLFMKFIRKFMIWTFPELSKLRNKAYDFESLQSYKFNVSLGENVSLGSIYNLNEVTIGDGTYLSTNSMVSRTSIAKYCSIGPNFLCGWGIHPTNGLSTSPMFYSTKKQNGTSLSATDKIEERKSIIIGNDVFIGANVTVLDGVTIGDGAIIGAGAVVSKDIPPYAIAVGCPIEIVKYRFEPNQIEALLKICWWDFEGDKLQDVEKLFFNINAFIEKYGN